MKTFLVSALALLVASPALAVDFSGRAVENKDWQKQFVGAPSWSIYGVSDTNSAAANDAALATIPGGVTIIGDCLTGGSIAVSGSWEWKSYLKVWQKPGCRFVTTNTNVNIYPVQSPANLFATDPTVYVEYYGYQLTCATPTQAVRSVRVWIDHFKFKNADIRGCGGIFPRGGDQEIAFNTIDTTPLLVSGNPGIRDLGTDQGLVLSPGMRANVWIHNNYVKSGDGALQSCQPAINPPGSWQVAVNTDGILYEDNYGVSGSLLFIIGIDNPGLFYSCKNITYRNNDGAAPYLTNIVPGGNNSALSHVRIKGGSFKKTSRGGHGALGIGNVTQGAVTFKGTHLTDVIIDGVTMDGAFRQSIEVVGCFPNEIKIINSTIGIQNSAILQEPNIELNSTCGVKLDGNVIDASGGGNAIQIGVDSPSSGDIITNNTIKSVGDTFSGIYLGAADKTLISGNTISAQSGATTATGISMMTGSPPSRTANSIIRKNTVSTPVTIVCAAPGQGNIVNSNPGASDCPP